MPSDMHIIACRWRAQAGGAVQAAPEATRPVAAGRAYKPPGRGERGMDRRLPQGVSGDCSGYYPRQARLQSHLMAVWCIFFWYWWYTCPHLLCLRVETLHMPLL